MAYVVTESSVAASRTNALVMGPATMQPGPAREFDASAQTYLVLHRTKSSHQVTAALQRKVVMFGSSTPPAPTTGQLWPRERA